MRAFVNGIIGIVLVIPLFLIFIWLKIKNQALKLKLFFSFSLILSFILSVWIALPGIKEGENEYRYSALGYFVLSLIVLIFIFNRQIRKNISNSNKLAVAELILVLVGFPAPFFISSVVTPWLIKTEQENLAKIKVYNIKDEPLLSAQGNKIGIKLSFLVSFPKKMYYSNIIAPREVNPEYVFLSKIYSNLKIKNNYDNYALAYNNKWFSLVNYRYLNTWENTRKPTSNPLEYEYITEMIPAYIGMDKNGSYCFKKTGDKDAENKKYFLSYLNSDFSDKTKYSGYFARPGYFTDQEKSTENMYDPKDFYNSFVKENTLECVDEK